MLALIAMTGQAQKNWNNGRLKVSDNQRFLQFENGKPFFWHGETAWLMPERLNREEVECYKDRPNIIWIMGGDIQGDIRPEVWETLATTIKQIDKNHLMTYHPRGRYTSAHWWSKASWIDFHTFQSGHRRYGQRMGNKDYPIPDNTEEDNWMYVDSTWAYKPQKPVLDDEPIYEGIPQGLHDADEPLWQACDVRRYAYWSVFAGSCGHTYGNNAIMQFYREGYHHFANKRPEVERLPHRVGKGVEDGILIAIDAAKDYLLKEQTNITSDTSFIKQEVDRNE